jgi:hypothetical protein
MILAAVPGTVGCGNGTAGVAPMPAPPEVALAPGGVPDGVALVPLVVAAGAVEAPPPPAWAVAAALAVDALASANAAKLGSIRWATRKTLFRGPAGLADGLALKEPAPPADSPRDSPQRNWVPRSADFVARGFGVAAIYPLW